MTLIHISSLIIERVAQNDSLSEFEGQKCLQLLMYKYKALMKHMMEEQEFERLLFDTRLLFEGIDDVQQTWSLWTLGDLGLTVSRLLIAKIFQTRSSKEFPFSPVESIPTCIEQINILWGPITKGEYSGLVHAVVSCWQKD